MSEIRVDTISEKTSANGVSIDGVTIKDGGIAATLASTITTADNTDTLSLISTDADGSSGPNLKLYRNSGSPADGDTVGDVGFTGRNDNSQDVEYARIFSTISDASDGTEDGRLDVNMMIGGTQRSIMKVFDTDIMFNDDSQDINFRVESNGNATMLFVDGGNNHVNIGTDTDLGGVLNVAGTQYNLVAGQNDFVIGSSNAGGATLVLDGDSNGDASGGDYSYIKHTTSGTLEIAQDSPSGTNTMLFKTADTHQWTLDASGNWLPAATDHGIYLGVTSATAANLLNDYEEGTWTMGITDGSNTMTLVGSGYNTGKYIKVGKKVYIQGFLDVQAVGSCSGGLTLTGLPFTASNAPNAYGAISVGYGASLSITAGTNLAGYIEGNTSDIRLRSWDSTGGTTVLQAGELSTGEFIFSGTYFV